MKCSAPTGCHYVDELGECGLPIEDWSHDPRNQHAHNFLLWYFFNLDEAGRLLPDDPEWGEMDEQLHNEPDVMAAARGDM